MQNKKVVCLENNKEFDSITQAAKWLVDNTHLINKLAARVLLSRHLNKWENSAVKSVGNYTFKYIKQV